MPSISRTALTLVKKGPPFLVLTYSTLTTSWSWVQHFAPAWVAAASASVTAFPWGRWRFFLQLIVDFANLSFVTKVQLGFLALALYSILLPVAMVYVHPRSTQGGLLRLSLEMIAHAMCILAVGPLYVLTFRIVAALHRDDFYDVWIELGLLAALMITPDFLDYYIPVAEPQSLFTSYLSMFSELWY